MEDKILGFQFEPVSAKPTCPNYSSGNDQYEPETQQNRLSSTGMMQLSKLQKYANQIIMLVLPRNSRS